MSTAVEIASAPKEQTRRERRIAATSPLTGPNPRPSPLYLTECVFSDAKRAFEFPIRTGRYFGLQHFGGIYDYFYAAFTLGTGLGPAAVGLDFEWTGN